MIGHLQRWIAVALFVACLAQVAAAATPPRLTQRVEPEYPAELIELGPDGEANLTFTVEADGHVSEIKVANATDPAFGRAASAAVSQWVYQPARSRDKPVKTTRVKQRFTFTVPQDRRLAILAGREVVVELTGETVEASGLVETLRVIEPPLGYFPRSLSGKIKRAEVRVSFVIRHDGLAVNPRVVESSDERVTGAGLLALCRARWEPPVVEGRSVNVRTELTIVVHDPREIVARTKDGPGGAASLDAATQQPDVPPRPLKMVDPVFPYELRRQGARGRVVVEFIVDMKGRVRDPHIVEATRPEFHQPVLDAIVKWRFEPGRKNGVPANARMQFPITFDLRERK